MNHKSSPIQSFTELRQFYQVANTGSFSGAAKLLNQTSAAVSAGVKRLESTLEVRLFERSTRTVSLTEEGKLLLRHCTIILNELNAVTDQLQFAKSKISGHIVVSSPGDLARTSLCQWIQDFQKRYSEITFDIRVSDSLVDLQKSGINVALRFGVPTNSTLIARPIVQTPQQVCASPEYLKRHGTPWKPEDLSAHNCLCFRVKEQKKDQWIFYQNQKKIVVPVSGNLVTDDSSLARQWAIDGLGFVYKSSLDVEEDIAKGRLIPVLNEYQGVLVPLYAVYPGKQNIPIRTRTFIDYLISRNHQLNSNSVNSESAAW